MYKFSACFGRSNSPLLWRKTVARVTITALSLAIGAAQAIDYKPAVNKDTIVVGLEKSISNLDAQVTSTGDSLLYAWQVYDTLYGFDSVGNLIPRMASGLKISSDRLSYTFTLRRGITFHNGGAPIGRANYRIIEIQVATPPEGEVPSPE